MLDDDVIDQAPDAYLASIGVVFAVFDEKTQDSGNVSYGVQIGEDRYFVKTAGSPDDPKSVLGYADRVSMLRNAVRLRRSCDHSALPRLHRVIESSRGPMLVYQWVDGEHVGASLQRVRRLPAPEVVRIPDSVYQVHHQLALLGWVAVDFYDGAMIYDFERRELHIVDLDLYVDAPFTNQQGRMFGSRRFMAPEEFVLGSTIDQRTTVFTMGRTAAVLMSDGTLERQPFRGSDGQHAVVRRSCREDPSERYGSPGDFYAAWMDAGS